MSTPGETHRRILRLAIPNIISNLSVPLLSAADTAILGHLEHMVYLGALAVGGIIFNFIYWGFGFLRMGTTGLTAQAYGDGDNGETTLILLRTVIIALISGCVLIASQRVIASTSFAIIDASPQVERYAREYFHIRVLAAPATLSLYAIQGWFLGMQNARLPLLLTVLSNICNLMFNLVFVYGLHLATAGVAWGTVLAQYLSLGLALFLVARYYPISGLARLKPRLADSQALRRIFQVNRDILVRTLALIFAFSFFTAKSAEHGDLVLATNTILLELIMLLAYGVDGFAFAAESLAGRFAGARDRVNLMATIRGAFQWGMGLGLLFALLYLATGTGLVRLFTDNETVIQLSRQYLWWVVLAPLINSFCFIWDGVFVGLTATAEMRNSMLLCTFIVFLPTYLLFYPQLGNHALWLALTLFMVMRGVTMSWYARKLLGNYSSAAR